MSTLDFDIEDVDMRLEDEDELDQWHSLLDASEGLEEGDLPPEHDEAHQSVVNVSEMDAPMGASSSSSSSAYVDAAAQKSTLHYGYSGCCDRSCRPACARKLSSAPCDRLGT